MTILLGQSGNVSSVGTISGVKAAGSMILLEFLTEQEKSGSSLVVSQMTGIAPQGYIVDIGPAVDAKTWGFKVGDRVVVQGTYVPVPKNGRYGRTLGISMAHDIKCILEETFQ